MAGLSARDYASAYEAAASWTDAFKAELGTALEPSLNARVLAAPQDTLADMRHLATAVNAALRQLGLAIRSPKTAGPS